MTPDLLLDALGLAAEPWSVSVRPAARLMGWFALDGGHVGALLALVGVALLVLMLAPRRHAHAVDRLARPVRSLLLGLLALVPIALLLGLLLSRGIVIGRGLLATLLCAAVAAGVSVCARGLGERALPEHGPLAQTAVGLLGLVLPLAAPIGLVVLAVAAPLGLGAFLSGWRTAPAQAQADRRPKRPGLR